MKLYFIISYSTSFIFTVYFSAYFLYVFYVFLCVNFLLFSSVYCARRDFKYLIVLKLSRVNPEILLYRVCEINF